MSTAMRMGPSRFGTTEVDALRGSGFFLVVIGIALIIVGFAAIGSAFIATFTTMLVFGILLIAGAVAQVVAAIMGRQWRGFFLHLLTGVLYFVAGMFLIDSPVAAALGLTLIIAAYLMVGGILALSWPSSSASTVGAGCCSMASFPWFWEFPSGGNGLYPAFGSSDSLSGLRCFSAAWPG